MLNYAKTILSRGRDKLVARPLLNLLQSQNDLLQSQHDLLIRAAWEYSESVAKNPLNRFGAKYFSQADEDGITCEIVRRLGIKNGIFAEFGVGNGLENNTLILLANGWRGFWVGGQDLAFN